MSGSDFTLAELDFFGDPDRLRREALREASGVDVRRQARQEATDASGAVRVVVGPLARVVEVRVSRRWPELLRGSEVGDALYEAYLAAARTAQAAAALAVILGAEETGQHVPPRVDAANESERSAERVWAELDRIAAERRRYVETGARSQAKQRRRGVFGPSGYVQVLLEGRHIVGVETVAARLAQVSADAVAGEALAAFRLAQGSGDGG